MRRLTPRYASLSGFVLLTAIIGCGGNGEPASGTDGRAATRETASGGVTPATAAEIRQRIAALKGKVVLVDIWATWCDPCKEAFPRIVALHNRYADRGLAVVSVNWDAIEDRAIAEAFAKDHKAPFESFLGTDPQQQFVPAIDRDWSGAVPCVIIYDRLGKRRHLLEGEHDIAEIAAHVEALL